MSSNNNKEWVGGAKEFFVCQTFIVKTAKGGRSSLVELEAFHLSNLEAAIRKADRMVENSQAVGAIAYSIIVDEDAGEYGDMQGLETFGSTPMLDDE
ncbi:MAG: hypothetical protein HRU28_17890 [Rhizobiales bacterium]|nr:hypothetical protein [Hyphomicrobiales bacterium]